MSDEHKTVPREPTAEMLRARVPTDDPNFSEIVPPVLRIAVWRAMYDAAPVAPTAAPTREDARELLRAMADELERSGEQVGYGFARPDNPHDFSPDHESCSAEEIAAHKAACEAFDSGEYTPPRGSETHRDKDGKIVMHILRAPWGIGSYTYVDLSPTATDLLARVRAYLAPPPGEPL